MITRKSIKYFAKEKPNGVKYQITCFKNILTTRKSRKYFTNEIKNKLFQVEKLITCFKYLADQNELHFFVETCYELVMCRDRAPLQRSPARYGSRKKKTCCFKKNISMTAGGGERVCTHMTSPTYFLLLTLFAFCRYF